MAEHPREGNQSAGSSKDPAYSNICTNSGGIPAHGNGDKRRKRKRRCQLPSAEWRASFLGALSGTGSIASACRAATICRRTAYLHRANDPEFAEEWCLALEEWGDRLVAEAWRRAVVGVMVRTPILEGGVMIIDWSRPGTWVDEQGNAWIEGVSCGPKRWTGEYLYAVEIRYSDTLLALLLKGARPEKYRSMR